MGVERETQVVLKSGKGGFEEMLRQKVKKKSDMQKASTEIVNDVQARG